MDLSSRSTISGRVVGILQLNLFCLTMWMGLAGSEAQEICGRLRLQLGQEIDTNAQRTYLSEITDELTKITVLGELEWKKGPHRLFFKYDGGGKIFYDLKSENEMANQLAAQYRFLFSSNWAVGSRWVFHDTSIDVHDRDYQLLSGELFVGNQKSVFGWELFAGGKYFRFKPDDLIDARLKFSHLGPVAGFRLFANVHPDTEGMFFYQIGVRLFFQSAWEVIDESSQPGPSDRLDLRHEAGLKIKHRIHYLEDRLLILEAVYMMAINSSNSFGSQAMWHRLQLLISWQLPWDMSLHLMGNLQFSSYPDGVYAEGDLYEPNADENENSLVLRINFPLWNDLSLILQGGLYRNDFNSQEFKIPAFHRETLLLGLAYNYSF